MQQLHHFLDKMPQTNTTKMPLAICHKPVDFKGSHKLIHMHELYMRKEKYEASYVLSLGQYSKFTSITLKAVQKPMV